LLYCSVMKSGTGYRKESLKRLINKKWFSVTMLGAILIVAVLGSLLVLEFEKRTNPEIQTYGDAVWLSFETMTTVGYGDKVPITPGGKVSVIMEMVVGISLLTGFIGSRASLRAEQARRREEGLDTKTRLRHHFVVCGWNSRGKYVLERLADSAKATETPIVLLCGLTTQPVEDDYIFFFQGNPTNIDDQKRANIPEAKSIILLADELGGGSEGDIDARTVLAALTARELNPDAKMTAEVLEPTNVQHLQRAGVSEVFDHNVIGGNLLAQSAISYGLIDLVTALAQKDAEAKVYRLSVEPDMVGETCGAVTLRLEKEKGYTVIGVRRPDGLRVCEEDAVLAAEDRLIVLSKTAPPNSEMDQQ
jgi:voltage-gated potassium channel